MAEMEKIIIYGKQEMKTPYYRIQFIDLEDRVTEWKEEKFEDIHSIWTKYANLMDEHIVKGKLELYRIIDDELGEDGRELIFMMVRRD